GELMPALLLEVDAELLRRHLNAPPGPVEFGVRHTLDLVEAGHGVADVRGVDQRLLALLGEGELLVVELLLVGRAQTGRFLPLCRGHRVLLPGTTPHGAIPTVRAAESDRRPGRASGTAADLRPQRPPWYC